MCLIPFEFLKSRSLEVPRVGTKNRFLFEVSHKFSKNSTKMSSKNEALEDDYSTDEFEESMDGDVDTKTTAQEYESDEFEVLLIFSKYVPDVLET